MQLYRHHHKRIHRPSHLIITAIILISMLCLAASVLSCFLLSLIAPSHPMQPASSLRLCLPTPSSFVHLPPSSISPFLDSIHISFLLRRNCSISSPPPASFALSLILILAGDIQLNPGPVPLEFAHLNVRSLSSITPILDKPFLLADFISDFSIELLAISETWLSPDTPPAHISSFTPDGFSFMHSPRLTGHALDLLITRSDSTLAASVDWTIPFLSDHYAIIASLSIPTTARPPLVKKTFRTLSKIHLPSFRHDLINSSIFVDPQTTLLTLNTQIHDCLITLLDKHAPLITRFCPSRQTKPFITPTILAAKKLRSHLETIYRRTKLPADHLAFKKQATILSKLITSEKNSFYRSKISQNKNSSRRLWSTINTLLHRKPSPSLPPYSSLAEITTSFSQFFLDKISSLTAKLPLLRSNPFTLPPLSPPLLHEFIPTTPTEIRSLIMSSSDSTCLLDLLPTSLLKSCSDILSTPLSSLINHSLADGIFPDSFKHALVSPLLKKPNLPHDSFSSYRPISNLSFISKLLERVVFSRLLTHISSFPTFSPFQSAYRRFHSTETALLRIHIDLLHAMDSKKNLLHLFCLTYQLPLLHRLQTLWNLFHCSHLHFS